MLVETPKITRNVDEHYLSFPLVGLDKLREGQKFVGEWRNKKGPFELSLTKAKKKKSNNQNALMWSLCQAIAVTLGTTKENVYRAHVRDYGVFYSGTYKNGDVAGVILSWQHNGLGWVADAIDNYDGSSTVLLYPGSSQYTTEQENRLIESLQQECDDLGLTVQINPALEALLKGEQK